MTCLTAGLLCEIRSLDWSHPFDLSGCRGVRAFARCLFGIPAQEAMHPGRCSRATRSLSAQQKSPPAGQIGMAHATRAWLVERAARATKCGGTGHRHGRHSGGGLLEAAGGALDTLVAAAMAST
eukprot:364463-Chlamydomonas_euryale.AAC.10